MHDFLPTQDCTNVLLLGCGITFRARTLSKMAELGYGFPVFHVKSWIYHFSSSLSFLSNIPG